MINLYIVSSNRFYSHALKTLLNNNSVLLSSIFCGNVFEFLSEKVSKDQDNILLLHTESFQYTKEQVITEQINYRLFSKVIVVDVHEQFVHNKVQLRNVYYRFIPSTLTFSDFVINLFNAIDGNDNFEGKMVEEAVSQLQKLRFLHYSQRFSEDELLIINSFKCDDLDKVIIDKLKVKPYVYKRLRSSIAEKLQVPNDRAAILIKAISTGIVKADEPDETFNLPLFL